MNFKKGNWKVFGLTTNCLDWIARETFNRRKVKVKTISEKSNNPFRWRIWSVHRLWSFLRDPPPRKKWIRLWLLLFLWQKEGVPTPNDKSYDFLHFLFAPPIDKKFYPFFGFLVCMISVILVKRNTQTTQRVKSSIVCWIGLEWTVKNVNMWKDNK